MEKEENRRTSKLSTVALSMRLHLGRQMADRELLNALFERLISKGVLSEEERAEIFQYAINEIERMREDALELNPQAKTEDMESALEYLESMKNYPPPTERE